MIFLNDALINSSGSLSLKGTFPPAARVFLGSFIHPCVYFGCTGSSRLCGLCPGHRVALSPCCCSHFAAWTQGGWASGL